MKTKYIVRSVPKKIVEATEWYMSERHMGLYDVFKEAVKEMGDKSKSSRLNYAFEYDDYREYIPYAYLPEHLDFNKYPLKYKHLL